MSNVCNAETGEEREYSLGPLQSLIAAFEQGTKGNWNTWTYGLPRQYDIKFGKHGCCLGNWWVRYRERP